MPTEFSVFDIECFKIYRNVHDVEQSWQNKVKRKGKNEN